MGRGLFNVESGSLSLCASSECSSLATLCQRALKWSLGLWRCGIVMTLGLCVSTCVHLHLCIFPSGGPSLSSHLYVKSTKCVALKRDSSSFNFIYIRSDTTCRNKMMRRVVFCIICKIWLNFPQDRNVLITPHASLTLVMGSENTNGVNECGKHFTPLKYPAHTVSIRGMAWCADKHIQSQAVRETF